MKPDRSTFHGLHAFGVSLPKFRMTSPARAANVSATRHLKRLAMALLSPLLLLGTLISCSADPVSNNKFAPIGLVHPGLLHSRRDLERIKAAVAERTLPTYAGYEVFRADPHSQADYKMRGPKAMVGRNPTVGAEDYDNDATAAYQCALMWTITGDMTYANKAKEIVNAWSATLKSITGKDAVLMAGLGPFKMVNAAEILRHTNAGWVPAEVARTEKHFREVIYPVIRDFAPFANGNWDAAAIKTVLAIGVFCDDRTIYERALRYYVDGAGDGRLSNYVINETGQCQESGRDQQHTQLGLAHLVDCCEIAWHQGLDLYGIDDNLLLKGFEYTAKYNLGEDVPFAETLDRTGKYRHAAISAEGRGRFRAVFEQILNHYQNRAGLTAPSVKRVVEGNRPEGPGGSGADHVGFGTLLFTNDAAKTVPGIPAAPAGLVAQSSPEKITLTWIAPVGTKTYTIKRGAETLARNVTAATFSDGKVQADEVYQYVVSAANDAGESPDSVPVSFAAGLPMPWTHQDVGGPSVAGGAGFDGEVFTLEGGGEKIGGKSDQFQFASLPVDGNATIVARHLPQLSSQLSRFGVMMRAGTGPDAAQVSLLIDADTKANLETPNWKVRLTTRNAIGAEAVDHDGRNLVDPTVSNGRLTGVCWLKLARAGNKFTGAWSVDGKTWIPVGTATVSLPSECLAGLAACSGIPVTTRVKFDHVAVTNPSGATGANRIVSPDGKVAVNFALQKGGVPAYAIDYIGKPIVLESALGLLPGHLDGFEIAKVSRSEMKDEWTPVYGERKTVPNNYRELEVDLKKPEGGMMRLTFRAYDEGAAFRYSFPAHAGAVMEFAGERSQFRFPADTFGWHEIATEGEYRRLRIRDFTPWCERPLTLEYASGVFASLAEAANDNYPRMLISPVSACSDTLVTALGGTTANEAKVLGPGDPRFTLKPGQATPWRMFVVGAKPGDLLERNFLMLNLNAPPASKDVSWIQPGKIMRDTALSTENAKAIMDFAAVGGLNYVLFDAGWYGPENAEESDPTKVAKPNLDIPEVVRYGKERGVGLFLYVNRRHVEKQRDVIFPLYEKWGIKGVKLGFVEVGSQAATAWVTETVAKAAESHLMVNLHDGYRPTGIERTYPNLLTVEGIRGNENFPTAEHNCTLPFTRFVAGPGDYTICYYDKRLKSTHAHQLAMSVVAYSPLQTVFWYDRPAAYQGEPEIEFFQHVPTVWDETKVVSGDIGKYATIARRSGNEWFVGTINGSEPRTLKVPLTFLDPRKRYAAHVYADEPATTTHTKVGVTTLPVDAGAVLDVPLQAAGGQALWITPVD
ncbi:MAG: glycoside hydrolase family 97 catalytic domain-containing protein [Luteolibacter sp.]|uniref:glycoside hydrolase family 97 catalytic domain-containing protein n=1 Tax=Luteolibacter sp. TaxID=1962973 RepID=UPI003263F6BD